MKRKLVWCLFFFSLMGCTSCMENQEVQKIMEDENKEYMVVLTDGKTLLTEVSEYICETMGAVHFDISGERKDEMKDFIWQADFVLIGTDKNLLEFEFSIRNCLDEEMLKEKKVSLFLVGQEEEKESFEKQFKEWYPEAKLLPVFTMNSDPESFQEEMGRANGWLTTVMTYDMVIE